MLEFRIDDFINLCSNFANGAVFLFIGVILLSFRPEQNIKRKGYGYTKKCLAISAFLMVLLNSADIVLILNGIDIKILNTYAIPVIYFLQLLMTTSALLSLVHSPQTVHTRKNIIAIPTLALILTYPVCYLMWDEGDVYLRNYFLFTQDSLTQHLSIAIIALVIVDLVLYIWMIVKETRIYRNKLRNSSEDNMLAEASVVARVVCSILAYFIITSVGIAIQVLSSSLFEYDANEVFVCANTILFAWVVVQILNIYHIAVNVPPVFKQNLDMETDEMHVLRRYEELLQEDNAKRHQIQSEDTNSQQDEDALKTFALSTSLEAAIYKWCRKPSKPYCQEGMTVRKAASQMGISERLLSSYINKVCNINFNTWLNRMRLEEVKRLIKEQPDLKMSEIASKTGYTDAPAMAKAFKKEYGIPPSTYKEQLRGQN